MEYEEFLHLEKIKIDIKKLEIENDQLMKQIEHLENNGKIRGKRAPKFVIVKAIDNALLKIKENKNKIDKLKSELEKLLYILASTGGFLTFKDKKEPIINEHPTQLKLID